MLRRGQERPYHGCPCPRLKVTPPLSWRHPSALRSSVFRPFSSAGEHKRAERVISSFSLSPASLEPRVWQAAPYTGAYESRSRRDQRSGAPSPVQLRTVTPKCQANSALPQLRCPSVPGFESISNYSSGGVYGPCSRYELRGGGEGIDRLQVTPSCNLSARYRPRQAATNLERRCPPFNGKHSLWLELLSVLKTEPQLPRRRKCARSVFAERKVSDIWQRNCFFQY